MKINAITNTNFKGLFIDKSKENGGNWRMEYHPSSWEGKMAQKTQFDINSLALPENEEIYIRNGNREISQDIFGTVSYLKDTTGNKDILRTTITEMPSMNLKDSLRVKEGKLDLFLKMKNEKLESLKSSLQESMSNIIYIAQEHNKYAADIKRGFGSHVYDKNTRAHGVSKNFDKMTVKAEEIGRHFHQYISISESVEPIRTAKEFCHNELAKIEQAELNGMLIDISKRDVENPNKPLINALENIGFPKKKIVALSHRTISMEEIIKVFGKDFNVQSVISFVENLMKQKI